MGCNWRYVDAMALTLAGGTQRLDTMIELYTRINTSHRNAIGASNICRVYLATRAVSR